MRASEQVLRVEGLQLRYEGQELGPLNLKLQKGQGALVLVADLGLMRRLMACFQGRLKPERGGLNWWPGAKSLRRDLWGEYEFLRQVGLVERHSQLLTNMTLLEHLRLYYHYVRLPDTRRRAVQILSWLGLEDCQDTLTEDLPESRRRLGLYAQMLCQRPRLILLERPAEFLDQDFARVWSVVRSLTEHQGLAYVVFDRRRDIYPAGYFDHTVSFGPEYI